MKHSRRSSPQPAPGSGRTFTYYAFISYKHADKRWGRWLQRRLESYSLPGRLREDKELPANVSPIFRDDTDLTGGKDVPTLLAEKIGQSKYLIVICSRHMQNHPEYIDYEINEFLAQGNPPGNIIPVIVDGEAVAADPRNEALPPALLNMGENRPLGIRVTRRSRREAILKLVASLLEIDLITIRSHDEQRKKRRLISLLAAGLALAVGLVGFLGWNVLNVDQARLREQNAYAWNEYLSGNRLQAEALASNVEDSLNFLMDPAIGAQAETVRYLAAIHPKFSPYAALETISDNRAMFDASGETVLLYDEHEVRWYDLSANLLRRFDVNKYGEALAAVCPDGRHALVSSFYSQGVSETALWLVDMWEETEPLLLNFSDRGDRQQNRQGEVLSLVQGKFSPDGRYVAAYRYGGYFNVNRSLAVWRVDSGERVFLGDGSLLDSGSANEQGGQVLDFEFIGSDIAHWTSVDREVYVDLTSGQAAVADKNQYKRSKLHGLTMRNGRYFVYCDPSDPTLVHFGDQGQAVGTLDLQLRKGQTALTEAFTVHEGRWGFLPIANKQGLIAACMVVDMRSLTLADSIPLSSKALGSGHSRLTVLAVPGADRVYLLLNEPCGASVPEIHCLRLGQELLESRVLLDRDQAQLLASENLTFLSGPHADILLLNTDSGSVALEIDREGRARLYSLEGFLSGSLQVSQNAAQPCLVAGYQQNYMLFSLIDPGRRLDEDFLYSADDSRFLAASGDGRMVAKRAGSRLAVWRDGERVLDETTEWASQVIFAPEGDSFAILEPYRIRFYDENGLLTDTFEPDASQYKLDHARFMGTKDRLVLLESEAWRTAVTALPTGRLLFLDRETGETQLVSENVVAEVIAAEEAYAVSADGRLLAAVEKLTQRGQSFRVISVWDASGRLLARTPNQESEGKTVIQLAADEGLIGFFEYVRFAPGGTLLAGLTRGAWLIDANSFDTYSYLHDIGQRTAPALPLSDGTVLFPSTSLRIWNGITGELTGVQSLSLLDPSLLTTVALGRSAAPVAAPGLLKPSADEAWCAASGAQYTLLYAVGQWETQGRLANETAHVLYADADRLIYDTGAGLYEIKRP